VRGAFEGGAAHLLPILWTEAKLFQDSLVQDAFSVRVRGRLRGEPPGYFSNDRLAFLRRVRHSERQRVDDGFQEVTDRRNLVVRHGVEQHVGLLPLLCGVRFHRFLRGGGMTRAG